MEDYILDRPLAFLPLIVIAIFAFAFALVAPFVWHSACVEASIYNRQNNASYTCSDFFWAADQINSNSQTIRIKQ